MRTLQVKCLISAVALAASSLCLASPQAAKCSSIYVFGDSVSDSGNVALAKGYPQGVPQPVTGNSYIPDDPYYPTGRFSNGPVWAEDFAALFGLAAAPSLLGGSNFAFAGARTGGPNVPAPTLTTQVGMFLGTHGTAPSNALYVIAEVGNDARDAMVKIAAGADVSQTIAAVSETYAGNIGKLVGTLRAAGATRFLVFDNVNLGLVPAVRAMGGNASALATALTASMNSALLDQLQGQAGVRVFDTFSFLSRVVRNPRAFGFKNGTDACGAVAGANCTDYVFWDGLHPTAAMHRLIARQAADERHQDRTSAPGRPAELCSER
jgi:phospholipase/lecithinase/hemolysin